MQLRELAHTRAGDKGNRSIISVVVHDLRDFALVEEFVTSRRVQEHFRGILQGRVERFVLPHLGALNFVLHDALAGGVTRSLALDAHGKCLSSAMLSLDVPVPAGWRAAARSAR
jgi:hypothetical protein